MIVQGADAVSDPVGPELDGEIERLSRASVTVLGDVALERRVVGGFADGPDVLLLRDEAAEPSAGAAIVRALAALRVSTAFICVLGDDLPGSQLTALIGAQPNVEPWLLVDGAKATTTATCYEDGERVVFRTLRRDARPMQPALRERMLRIAGDAMMATSLTVLSERGGGTLDAELIAEVLNGARQMGRRVIADFERGAGADWFRGCDSAIGIADGADEAQATDLRRSAELSSLLLFDPASGLVIADHDGAERIALRWPEPAGDYARVVAAFAAALAVGRGPRMAGRIAAATLNGARHAPR